jgi:hypothetical protein
MQTMQTQPIDPATPISISLQAQQWNNVISILGDGPYRIVAPLIAAIAQQTQAFAAGVPMRAGNGALAAEAANDPS